MSDMIPTSPSNTETDPLKAVWEVIQPLLMPERAETIAQRTRDWVREEFTLYSNTHQVTDVTCEIELTNCKALFKTPGGEVFTYGYRLVLQISGVEPHTPVTTVDCFFVQGSTAGAQICDLILSKAAPGDAEGTAGLLN